MRQTSSAPFRQPTTSAIAEHARPQPESAPPPINGWGYKPASLGGDDTRVSGTDG